MNPLALLSTCCEAEQLPSRKADNLCRILSHTSILSSLFYPSFFSFDRSFNSYWRPFFN